MKRLWFIVPLLLVSGCRQQEQYGNFAQVESIDIVRDATNAMMFAFPPAQTRLNVMHKTDDPFGSRLVATLRTHGYGMDEGSGKSGKDAHFSYVLDVLEDGKQLQVSIQVGDERLSRVYSIEARADATDYIPSGPWARRR